MRVICTFCGAASHEVAKLVAGPEPHAVCDRCGVLLAEIANVPFDEPRAPSPGSCSFCGASGVSLILPSDPPEGCPVSSICHDCARLVGEILAGRAG